MEKSLKNILYKIGYYTLATLIILLSFAFMVAISFVKAPIYQQVIYDIWSILLIGTVVFDMLATNYSPMKYISGLMFYSITFLCIVMAIIVYSFANINGIVPIDNIIFPISVGFSMALSILGIVYFWQGEHLIDLYKNIKTNK